MPDESNFGTAMNRSDFQKMAKKRLKDAKTLLEQRRYSGAYYLCGYVVECGLKACIAKRTKQFDFPPDRKTINDIYTHDLQLLLKSSELKQMLEKEIRKNKKLEVNWSLVKDWKETSRYEKHTRKETRDLYLANSRKKSGVLKWISQCW